MGYTFDSIYRIVKVLVKLLAIILLLFNGTGALYGGLSFMLHPDGSGLQMSVSYLLHSPFPNFFVPGLLLFVFNGILSLVAIGIVFFSHRYGAWAVVLEGSILVVWIVVQIIMVRDFRMLHAVMFGTGALMILTGIILVKIAKKAPV